jgi:hypothetical protein
MSIEESQEELFNRLLTDLQKSPKEFLFSFGASMKTPASTNSSDLPELKVHVNIEGIAQRREVTGGADQESLKADLSQAMIKVMNSGIFYKGGLQGRSLKRNALDYKIYFFNDLAFFILMATDYLINDEEKLDKRFYDLISKNFDSAINKIYKLISIAEVSRSKRNVKKLGNITRELEDIKCDLLSKNDIRLPITLRIVMIDRIDSLINLFKEQLPDDTPDDIISQAISTLIHSFNIFTVEPEAIRQRMTRAKLK